MRSSLGSGRGTIAAFDVGQVMVVGDSPQPGADPSATRQAEPSQEMLTGENGDRPCRRAPPSRYH